MTEGTKAPAPETELDSALDNARRNPTQPNDFYDAFLNANLIIPVRIAGKDVGTWKQVGLKDKFHPYFTPREQRKLVPVFDRLERLKSWAESADPVRSFDYAELKCHILLHLLGNGVALVLNPGTAWSHSFSLETIEKLKKSMRPVSSN